MTTVFPDSIDSLPRPLGNTKRNASGGLNLSTVVDNISDAIEAIENVESGSPPLSAIVNGGLNIWQEGATFTSIASGTWGPDNFIYTKAGAVVHDLLRSTDVPTVAQALRTTYSLHLDVTTADASIAVGDFAAIATRIEGYRWSRFDQKQWSFRFWVKAAKTGIHYVYARNSGGDRSCVMPFTVIAADTWEEKKVTFPANPSAGTWDYTTGRGIEIGWCLMAGSTFQTTAGAWQSGDFKCASDQVNELDSTANNFRIALIGPPTVGPFASPFRPSDIGLEELRTKRYLQVMAPSVQHQSFGFGQVYNTTDAVIYVGLPVPMRSTVILSVSNVTDFALSISSFALATSPSSITILMNIGNQTIGLQVTGGGASLTAGDITMLLSKTGITTATLKFASRIP